MSTTPLPKNHEIRAVWRQDAEPGQVWRCQRCEYVSNVGCNAAYHALQTDHGLPELVPGAPPAVPPRLPGVRVGDAMQLLDDVHLLLEIADAALVLARTSGAHPTSLTLLRGLYDRVKFGVDARRDPGVQS